LVEACTNYKVRRLRICAILRDWQQSRVDTKKTYPKAAVHMVDIKKWPMAETADFIRTRMKMHMDVHNDHETYADEPDMLPPAPMKSVGYGLVTGRCSATQRPDLWRRCHQRRHKQRKRRWTGLKKT